MNRLTGHTKEVVADCNRLEARTKEVVANYYKDYAFLKNEAQRCEKEICDLVKKLALGVSVTLKGFNVETRARLCEQVLENELVSLTMELFVENVGGSVVMPVSVKCCTITPKVIKAKKVHV